MGRRRIPSPDLPPPKPRPSDGEHDPCRMCFTRGAWYAYGPEETTIAPCARCKGEGWTRRTHPADVECPDVFPGHCSACGCACDRCESVRSRTPRWEDFERRHVEYPGNGNPGKFIAWGTEPFRHKGGGVSRFALFQPWPTTGLVWHRCYVGAGGRVETSDSVYDRSSGAFYDDEFGGAIDKGRRAAVEKMTQILSR